MRLYFVCVFIGDDPPRLGLLSLLPTSKLNVQRVYNDAPMVQNVYLLGPLGPCLHSFCTFKYSFCQLPAPALSARHLFFCT